MENTVRYEKCPKCEQNTYWENGNVWLEDDKLRISYNGKCKNCGYEINYDDVIYEY